MVVRCSIDGAANIFACTKRFINNKVLVNCGSDVLTSSMVAYSALAGLQEVSVAVQLLSTGLIGTVTYFSLNPVHINVFNVARSKDAPIVSQTEKSPVRFTLTDKEANCLAKVSDHFYELAEAQRPPDTSEAQWDEIEIANSKLVGLYLSKAIRANPSKENISRIRFWLCRIGEAGRLKILTQLLIVLYELGLNDEAADICQDLPIYIAKFLGCSPMHMPSPRRRKILQGLLNSLPVCLSPQQVDGTLGQLSWDESILMVKKNFLNRQAHSLPCSRDVRYFNRRDVLEALSRIELNDNFSNNLIKFINTHSLFLHDEEVATKFDALLVRTSFHDSYFEDKILENAERPSICICKDSSGPCVVFAGKNRVLRIDCSIEDQNAHLELKEGDVYKPNFDLPLCIGERQIPDVLFQQPIDKLLAQIPEAQVAQFEKLNLTDPIGLNSLHFVYWYFNRDLIDHRAFIKFQSLATLADGEKHFKELINNRKYPYITTRDLFKKHGVSQASGIFHSLVYVHHVLVNSRDPKVIEPLSPKLLKAYFQHLFFYPEILKPVFDRHFKLKSVDVYDGADCKATWAPFVEKLVSTVGEGGSQLISTDFAEEYQKVLQSPCSELESVALNQLVGDWTYKKALGRTLLFEKNGRYRAIKLQKVDESLEALHRENGLINLLNRDQCPQRLLTKWPEAKGVVNIYDLPQSYANDVVVNLALLSGSINAYTYEFEGDSYFCYLHDPSLSMDEFKEARGRMLHDLFVLARHGIVYTALADLFHNLEHTDDRADQGAYLPLADLFRRQTRHGSGRITGMWEAVEYPNARASGLADVADTDLVTNLIQHLQDTPYKDRLRLGHKGLDVFLLAHFAASYLLVDQLILGHRELQNMDWEDENYLKTLGGQMLEGFSIALSAYTGVPQLFAEAFAGQVIDWTSFARQMSFWMRNDQKGYVEYVKRGSVPAEIFGKSKCMVGHTGRFRGWDDTHGFMLNPGKPDSGPVNGQHMVKEGEKSWYVMATLLTTMQNSQAKAEKWKQRSLTADGVYKVRCLSKSLQHNPTQRDLEIQWRRLKVLGAYPSVVSLMRKMGLNSLC